MIAHAKPEPDIDSEPTYNQLWCAKGDFEDVLTAIQLPRWPVASKDPRVSVIETLRATVRDLAEQAVNLLKAVTAPPAGLAVTDGHWNDRPEDCPCPECRSQVDQWAIAYAGHLQLCDPSAVADHPKANPHLSVRELHRLHQD